MDDLEIIRAAMLRATSASSDPRENTHDSFVERTAKAIHEMGHTFTYLPVEQRFPIGSFRYEPSSGDKWEIISHFQQAVIAIPTGIPPYFWDLDDGNIISAQEWDNWPKSATKSITELFPVGSVRHGSGRGVWTVVGHIEDNLILARLQWHNKDYPGQPFTQARWEMLREPEPGE